MTSAPVISPCGMGRARFRCSDQSTIGSCAYSLASSFRSILSRSSQRLMLAKAVFTGLLRRYSRRCLAPFRYRVSTTIVAGSLRLVLIFRLEKVGTTGLAAVTDKSMTSEAGNLNREGPMFILQRKANDTYGRCHWPVFGRSWNDFRPMRSPVPALLRKSDTTKSQPSIVHSRC